MDVEVRSAETSDARAIKQVYEYKNVYSGNTDAQKAYKMYLNSIELSEEEISIKTGLIHTHYGTVKVVPFKH